jgi:hypothetical protein
MARMTSLRGSFSDQRSMTGPSPLAVAVPLMTWCWNW